MEYKKEIQKAHDDHRRKQKFQAWRKKCLEMKSMREKQLEEIHNEKSEASRMRLLETTKILQLFQQQEQEERDRLDDQIAREYFDIYEFDESGYPFIKQDAFVMDRPLRDPVQVAPKTNSYRKSPTSTNTSVSTKRSLSPTRLLTPMHRKKEVPKTSPKLSRPPGATDAEFRRLMKDNADKRAQLRKVYCSTIHNI